MNRATRRQLIDALSADVSPVARPLSPLRVACLWVLASLPVLLAFMLWRAPWRPTVLEDFLSSPRLQLEIAATALLALLAAWVAFRQGTPGLSRSALAERGCQLALVLWLGLLGWSFMDPPIDHGMLGKRDWCWLEAPLLSLLAGVPALLLLRRRWVLRPVSCGFFLGLSAGVLCLGLMQLLCMYEPMHLLVRHFLPALATALAGAAIGRWLR